MNHRQVNVLVEDEIGHAQGAPEGECAEDALAQKARQTDRMLPQGYVMLAGQRLQNRLRDHADAAMRCPQAGGYQHNLAAKLRTHGRMETTGGTRVSQLIREPSGMKVVHVVPSFYPAFNYGGPITSVYELCAGLVRQGCEVRVLTTDANGLGAVLEVAKDAPVTLPPGVLVRYCPRIFRHSISPRLLARLVPALRWADVVHLTAVYNFPTLPTLAACRWLGKPLVWSPRGALQRWQSSRRPGLKTAWESACRQLAPAEMVLHVTSAQEAAESAAKFPRARAVVIPNGVELPPRLDHRQGAGRLRLLFLGRLDPKKGIENLLAACQRLQLESPWCVDHRGLGRCRLQRRTRGKRSPTGIARAHPLCG